MSKGSTAFRIIAGLLFIANNIIALVINSFYSWLFENVPYYLEEKMFFSVIMLLFDFVFYLCFIPIGILIIANAKKFFSFLFAVPTLYFLISALWNLVNGFFIPSFVCLVTAVVYLFAIVFFNPMITDKVKALKNLWFVPAILDLVVLVLPYIAYEWLNVSMLFSLDIIIILTEVCAFLLTGLWLYSDSRKTVPAYQPQPQYAQPQPQYTQPQPQYTQPQPQYAQPQPQYAQPQPQPVPTLKFCPKCGCKLEEGTVFCGKCGAHIAP